MKFRRMRFMVAFVNTFVGFSGITTLIFIILIISDNSFVSFQVAQNYANATITWWKFAVLLAPSDCSESEKLLIFVLSRPKNQKKREVIRSSWGFKRKHVSIIFVLGLPHSKEIVLSELQEESSKHRDILLGGFEDLYQNLPKKTFMLLNWTSSHCSYANLLMKTDDDVMVFVENVMTFVKTRVNGVSNTIFGHCLTGAVRRNPIDKWFIPKEVVPFDRWPYYCSGLAYFMTHDVIKKLVFAAKNHNYIKIEDAFFTGVLAEICGVKRMNVPYLLKRRIVSFNSCELQRRILTARGYHTPQDVDRNWKKFQNGRISCIADHP